jgi:hypothetical protein
MNLRHSILGVVMIFVSVSAWAQQMPSAGPGGKAQPFPRARVLEMRITRPHTDPIVVRAGVELLAEGCQWFDVLFNVFDESGQPVKTADGKDFVRTWGKLFTPDGARRKGRARWSDIRLAITRRELEGIANLPKNATTTLMVTCEVYDPRQQQYISKGWSSRTPLYVTTDAGGTIIRVDTFFEDARQPEQFKGSQTATGRQIEFRLNHLKLKGGIKAGRLVDIKHNVMDLMVLGRRWIDFTWTSRGIGDFVEPIESPAQAMELAELLNPNAVILENEKQFLTVVSAARSLGYSESIRGTFDPNPDQLAATVEEIPGRGYVVRMTVVKYRWHRAYGSVCQVELFIGRDGRVGDNTRVLIEAPPSESGMPAGPMTAPRTPSHPAAWDKAIRESIQATGARAIAPKYVVTDTPVILPAPFGSAELFLPPADWPGDVQ